MYSCYVCLNACPELTEYLFEYFTVEFMEFLSVITWIRQPCACRAPMMQKLNNRFITLWALLLFVTKVFPGWHHLYILFIPFSFRWQCVKMSSAILDFHQGVFWGCFASIRWRMHPSSQMH
jgi:hypothetical protein